MSVWFPCWPHGLQQPAKPLLVKRDPVPCWERSEVHEEPQAGDKGCAVFWVRRTADTWSRVSGVSQWGIWGLGPALMSVLCQKAHALLPEIPRGVILESHNTLHNCIAWVPLGFLLFLEFVSVMCWAAPSMRQFGPPCKGHLLLRAFLKFFFVLEFLILFHPSKFSTHRLYFLFSQRLLWFQLHNLFLLFAVTISLITRQWGERRRGALSSCEGSRLLPDCQFSRRGTGKRGDRTPTLAGRLRWTPTSPTDVRPSTARVPGLHLPLPHALPWSRPQGNQASVLKQKAARRDFLTGALPSSTSGPLSGERLGVSGWLRPVPEKQVREEPGGSRVL